MDNTPVPPDAPVITLAASDGDDTIVRWNFVPGDGTKYRVYRDSNFNGEYTLGSPPPPTPPTQSTPAYIPPPPATDYLVKTVTP